MLALAWFLVVPAAVAAPVDEPPRLDNDDVDDENDDDDDDDDDDFDDVPVVTFASLKVDITLGWFYPQDVNDYLDDEMAGTMLSGFTGMVMHFGFGLSVSVYPLPFLGLRPNIQVYMAPKEFQYTGASSSTEIYMLAAFAPGFAADFIVNPASRAQFFVSAGFAYYLATFNGDFENQYSGDGPTAEAGVGLNLMFDGTLTKGMSLGLYGKYADIPVKSSEGEEYRPNLRSMNFSGVVFRFGPIFRF